MEGILLTSVLSSVGLGISSFFGFFLIRNKKLQNRLLAWLCIALSLRITKSIFYLHIELPLIIKNLGLAANLAVGPLLYLYVRSFVTHDSELKNWESVHFIPTLIYLLFSPVLPNGSDSYVWFIGYSLILFQSFVYVFLSASLLIRKLVGKENKHIRWVTALISCLALMWVVYTLIFVQLIPLYSLGPLSFSISIFVLLYIALHHNDLFLNRIKPKYSSTRMSDAQGSMHFAKLKQLLDSKGLYKKPDISLSTLAIEMGLLQRDVSYVINNYANCNFSRFVNGYRIEEAKKLIVQYPSKKMISVAHESGFNNLGTFNQAFKMITGMTPSEFKKSSTS